VCLFPREPVRRPARMRRRDEILAERKRLP